MEKKKKIILGVFIIIIAVIAVIALSSYNQSVERNELMKEKYNQGYKIDFNTTNISVITNEIQGNVQDITKIEILDPTYDNWAIIDNENKLMYIGKFESSQVAVYTLS